MSTQNYKEIIQKQFGLRERGGNNIVLCLQTLLPEPFADQAPDTTLKRLIAPTRHLEDKSHESIDMLCIRSDCGQDDVLRMGPVLIRLYENNTGNHPINFVVNDQTGNVRGESRTVVAYDFTLPDQPNQVLRIFPSSYGESSVAVFSDGGVIIGFEGSHDQKKPQLNLYDPSFKERFKELAKGFQYGVKELYLTDKLLTAEIVQGDGKKQTWTLPVVLPFPALPKG